MGNVNVFPNKKIGGFPMKKLIKTLAVLAAVAALGFGYVSCSSDGSSSDDSKKTETTKTDTSATTSSSAVFKGTADLPVYGKTEVTVKLNADKSYVISWGTMDKYKGTYTLTGDFTNGTEIMHQTHKYSSSQEKWVDEVEDEEMAIKDGKASNPFGTYTKQ